MYVFFVKQKTAYEMRISDWSSDVCSSDLAKVPGRCHQARAPVAKTVPVHAGRHPRIGVHLVRAHQVGGSRVMHVERDDHRRWLRELIDKQIGRASGRERVCQYV